MQGICIDAGSTTVLQEGQNYYLFDHGPNNYYVSKFNNINAHCGSYQRKHFKLVEDQGHFEHHGELLKDELMIAEIIKKYKGYGFNLGDRFIVCPTKYNHGTHYYYYDLKTHKFCGCMPVDIFKISKKFDGVLKPLETHQIQTIDESNENASNIIETSENEEETGEKITLTGVWIKKDKPDQKTKGKKGENVPDGQISIFDFI